MNGPFVCMNNCSGGEEKPAYVSSLMSWCGTPLAVTGASNDFFDDCVDEEKVWNIVELG